MNKSTFLFSFDEKQKYLVKNDSIYCSDDYGPVFGTTLFNKYYNDCKECKKKEETIRNLYNNYNKKKLKERSGKVRLFQNRNEIYFTDNLNKGLSYNEKDKDLTQKSKESVDNNKGSQSVCREDSWKVKELEVYRILFV